MIKVAKASTGPEEIKQIEEALNYGYFGLAYKVAELEKKIKDFLGTTREVICVGNCTSALHLALDVAGVGPGDEVIVPAFTFVATAQAISMTGATPVLCDTDPGSFLLSVEDVKRKITPKTKAIMPVHYSGSVCDMDALMELARQRGIRVVEDAAHAFGSFYKGRKVGSFGDITCFSFDSIKVMTCGEGGAIVCNDPAEAELFRQKRLLGIDRKAMHTKNWKERSWIYDVKVRGYRYHMSNISAAIGLAQIEKVDGFIKRRREICHKYIDLLSSCDSVRIPDLGWDHIAPFMFPILTVGDERDALRDYLKDKDIETGVSYIPLYKFGYYHDDAGKYPNTEKIFRHLVCLPLHPELTDEDVDLVCSELKAFYKGKKETRK